MSEKDPTKLIEAAGTIMSDASADKNDRLSALELLSKALEIEPEMPNALSLRISVLVSLKRYDDAHLDALRLLYQEDHFENQLFVCFLEDYLGYEDYKGCYLRAAEKFKEKQPDEFYRNANYVIALGLADSMQYQAVKEKFFSVLDNELKEFYQFVFQGIDERTYVNDIFQ